MAIGANKVVSVNYILSDDEGNLIQRTNVDEPFVYLSGNNQILPRLEQAIDSMIIGGKKNIELKSPDAYGEYDDNAVQHVKRQEFPEGTNLEEGMEFMASTPDGKPVPFVIKEVLDDDITIDFNHPLAGKNLNFDIELIDVRDATKEELEHGHIHGPGGHHH
jgi:FKBP-type peptidyl-prolyl cis-trans isomerase SlyD